MVAKGQRAYQQKTGGEQKKKLFKGVRMRSWGKWVSEIRLPNTRTRLWLGSFLTAEQAARAYDVAVTCLRGPSATLNFPDSPPAYAPLGLPTHKIQELAVAAAAAVAVPLGCPPPPPPTSSALPSYQSHTQQEEDKEEKAASASPVLPPLQSPSALNAPPPLSDSPSSSSSSSSYQSPSSPSYSFSSYHHTHYPSPSPSPSHSPSPSPSHSSSQFEFQSQHQHFPTQCALLLLPSPASSPFCDSPPQEGCHHYQQQHPADLLNAIASGLIDWETIFSQQDDQFVQHPSASASASASPLPDDDFHVPSLWVHW